MPHNIFGGENTELKRALSAAALFAGVSVLVLLMVVLEMPKQRGPQVLQFKEKDLQDKVAILEQLSKSSSDTVPEPQKLTVLAQISSAPAVGTSSMPSSAASKAPEPDERLQVLDMLSKSRTN